MDESIVTMGKKTWYKWSFYINVILFLIIASFIVLLILDSYNAGYVSANSFSATDLSNAWLHVLRDLGFLAVALALVFFQFFRNLSLIRRRSL